MKNFNFLCVFASLTIPLPHYKALPTVVIASAIYFRRTTCHLLPIFSGANANYFTKISKDFRQPIGNWLPTFNPCQLVLDDRSFIVMSEVGNSCYASCDLEYCFFSFGETGTGTGSRFSFIYWKAYLLIKKLFCVSSKITFYVREIFYVRLKCLIRLISHARFPIKWLWKYEK